MNVTNAAHLQQRLVDRSTSNSHEPVLPAGSSGLKQALVIGGGVALLAGFSATASLASYGRGGAVLGGAAATVTGAAALVSGLLID